MVNSTKEIILNYLLEITEDFDFTYVEQYSAKKISEKIHVSRSLASQYLNELVKENKVMKINSRPVYFLHRGRMEEIYKTKFQNEDFYDFEEIKQYIQKHSLLEGNYSNIVGSTHSLSSIIKQIRGSFKYPPSGLPVVIYGEKGTGKRTIVETIYMNAAKKGEISKETKIYKFEFTDNKNETLERQLFGDKDHKGVIDNNELILILCNIHYLSDELQDALATLLDTTRNNNNKSALKKKHIRFIFITDSNTQLYMSDRLLKNIPIIIRMPSLSEKSQEEKEELVINFIKMEDKNINKKVILSSSVLRALVNGNYTNNLIGMKSAIQRTCANALTDSSNSEKLILHSYHLPDSILKTMPISVDENVVYIDTSNYVKSETIDYILNYFNRIIHSFNKEIDFNESINNGKHECDVLNDYLSFRIKISSSNVRGLEMSLNHIIENSLSKRFLNLPSGLTSNISKILYICDIYKVSINKWIKENYSQIENVKNRFNNHILNEVLIMDDIARLIHSNLEIEINELIEIILVIYLHHYNSHIISHSISGLIVCHGYSTATSIAQAVNTLLGTYVYDAVDMPLDTTIDEIKEVVLERLERFPVNNLIVMVDMGSLEQIGNSLSSAMNCNIGVINNVSTRLALNLGYKIISNMDMKEALDTISKESLSNYTIVKRKKNDVILFTSESGMHMAQRMRELFENSFIANVPIDLEVCDYNQLVSMGNSHEYVMNNNILFITGTANPHVEGITFISLEDIISGNNIEIMIKELRKYLDIEQLKQILDQLRKNFTLINVVGYLTILNPKILLDNVTDAVDKLQEYLNEKFSGKTLIGIYIHICCLIERLVTKSAITDYDDIEEFEKNHKDFITYIYKSFSEVSKRYNITIPIIEIAYLYEFIENDKDLNKGFIDNIGE